MSTIASAPETPTTTTTPAPPSNTPPPPSEPAVGGTPTPAAPPAPEPPAPPAADFSFDNLTLPEGYEVDADLSKDFLSIVNDPKLSRADLGKALIDLQAKSLAKASERGSESFATTVSGWRKSLNEDPDIGGPKLTTTLATANRLVDRFGSPGLKQVLQVTGMSEHPEFARMLVNLAPFVTEPPPITGGAPGETTKYSPSNLYPNQGA